MRRAMDFTVEKMCGSARLGCVTGRGDRQGISLPTPNCTLYTRLGCVPHLTRDMVLRLHHLPRVVQYSLTNWAQYQESLAAYEKGINKFTAMEDFLSYVVIRDTSSRYKSGYNDKFGTSVWCRGGRLKLDVSLFWRCVEALAPAACQALCDSDTDAQASRKRVRKSVDRSLDFLEQLDTRRRESKRLQCCSLVGTAVGGHILEERLRSAQETSMHQTAGCSIEGFHNFGPDTEHMNFAEIKELVEKQLEALPSGGLRVFPGVYGPAVILEAVAAGVDLFESVYPYIVTERGSALTFKYDLKLAVKGHEELGKDLENEQQSESHGLEINLKDKCYASDFGPLLEGCTCYTCEKHSRAYINHLLNTSELLAGTLLMMHNLHHYFGFFAVIRDALQIERLEELTAYVKMQEKIS